MLVFDEVMTGFRIAKGCAQEHFGVTPDLTTMGKVIGGGLPVGAYGGKRKIMEMVAPAGPMYQVRAGQGRAGQGRAVCVMGEVVGRGGRGACTLLVWLLQLALLCSLVTVALLAVAAYPLLAPHLTSSRRRRSLASPHPHPHPPAGGHPERQPSGHGCGHQDA